MVVTANASTRAAWSGQSNVNNYWSATRPFGRRRWRLYPGHVRKILALYYKGDVPKAESLVKVLAREPWRRLVYSRGYVFHIHRHHKLRISKHFTVHRCRCGIVTWEYKCNIGPHPVNPDAGSVILYHKSEWDISEVSETNARQASEVLAPILHSPPAPLSGGS
jgi:hypothetical protein